MTEPLAFLNGRFVPQSEATISLADAGFVFGATVTDLCRTFRHRIYRWSEHLERFRHSCKMAAIEPPSDDATATVRAEELAAHNAKLIDANADLALVMFATPGPIGYYLGQATAVGDQPTFGMHTFPLPFARYRPWIERGVVLKTPSVRAVPAECVDPHIKQRSRMHWWLAEQEARAHGAQALLLDLAGNVTETASSNFVLVKGGALIAPPREGVLEGVSLGVVADLCKRLGMAIDYRPIALDECYAADEALLTCTSYCIAGVRRINDRELPWPGPMLKRLVEAWSAEIGVDIHRQILEN